nr:hypothetical protein CFP56_09338 [Quercus suber]
MLTYTCILKDRGWLRSTKEEAASGVRPPSVIDRGRLCPYNWPQGMMGDLDRSNSVVITAIESTSEDSHFSRRVGALEIEETGHA